MNSWEQDSLEKILDKSAKGNMLNWDIARFKESHPKLFKAIIEAMSQVQKGTEDFCKGSPIKHKK